MKPVLERAAFTLAFGKPIYMTMAIALARSFLLHNRDNGIDFAIVTDRPIDERPDDLASITWIEVPKDHPYGRGFTPKLYLDELSPANRSLFIDSDCICVGSVAPAFESFSGHDVSVIGKWERQGEWFGDIASIAEKLNIDGYCRFNGGVYYIESGDKSRKIYETARGLIDRYDDLGFVRLRNYPNDEVLMAVAMEIHGEHPISDDGTIMNTTIDASAGMTIDVLAGRALLRNPLGHPKRAPSSTLDEMRPAIVHFCGLDITSHPYKAQIVMLACHASGWSDPWARVWATALSTAPHNVAQVLKSTLRPFYRAVIGPRPVRKTARDTNDAVSPPSSR